MFEVLVTKDDKEKWIELPADYDYLEEVAEFFDTDKVDVETVYCDEHDFGDVLFSKDIDIFELNELLEGFEYLSEYEQKTVLALCEIGYYFESAMENYKNFTLYEDINLKELAQDFVKEGVYGNVSEKLLQYIDYEEIATDLAVSGYTETQYGVLC